jgi:hypothetical protein
VAIWFSAIMLILFTAAGYMLDFSFLYGYGILFALGIPIGEWLYQEVNFSHHGYPVIFGIMCGIMLTRGLYKFITLIKKNPLPMEEQAMKEPTHG